MKRFIIFSAIIAALTIVGCKSSSQNQTDSTQPTETEAITENVADTATSAPPLQNKAETITPGEKQKPSRSIPPRTTSGTKMSTETFFWPKRNTAQKKPK